MNYVTPSHEPNSTATLQYKYNVYTIRNQTDNSVTKTLNKTGRLVYMKAFFSLVGATIQKESLQPPFAPLVFHPSSHRTTSFTRPVSAERKTSPCFFLIGIKKKKKETETVVVGGGGRLILSNCWTQNQWRFDRSRCSQLDKC